MFRKGNHRELKHWIGQIQNHVFDSQEIFISTFWKKKSLEFKKKKTGSHEYTFDNIGSRIIDNN